MSINNRKSKEQYLKDITKKHGDRYDYSLVEYTNHKGKIKIICKVHGEFKQAADSHLRGAGCSKCNKYVKKVSKKEYFDRIFSQHGNRYDYSLVNYTHMNNKIKIICSIHGMFEQRAESHAAGSGCQKCAKKINVDEKYKQCSKCKLYKEKTEFGILNKSLDKLSYSCKLCLYSRIKQWLYENISIVRKTKDKWSKNNKESTRLYERNRRKKDKNFQLKANMRGRLNSSFKKFDTNASIRYLDYSIGDLKNHLESKFTKGMSWENYGKNGWEIDHIKPIILFDLNIEQQQLECFNYKNTRPLLMSINRRKLEL